MRDVAPPTRAAGRPLPSEAERSLHDLDSWKDPRGFVAGMSRKVRQLEYGDPERFHERWSEALEASSLSQEN